MNCFRIAPLYRINADKATPARKFPVAAKERRNKARVAAAAVGREKLAQTPSPSAVNLIPIGPTEDFILRENRKHREFRHYVRNNENDVSFSQKPLLRTRGTPRCTLSCRKCKQIVIRD
ncbi:MAG TPA: hypothetical protein ENJ77_00560 [Candidatus Moranbacteria bacterium]|nr:hypothetical protein [Candidatus Moranbacteria bacterium]